ncbi:MAG: glycosyltransferase [Kiritimatiellae bacterium]|nr:glycosyltransferase [Kiritimatiellia bacterium]
MSSGENKFLFENSVPPSPSAAAPKRIVFVLSGYGKVLRGAERFVADLAGRLADRYRIAVLGGGPATPDAPFAVPLRFPDRTNRLTAAADRTPGIGHFLRLFQLDPLNWEWLFCALAAKKWLLANPCDLLVTEGGRWGGLLGRWAHRRLGIPVVDVAHGAPSRWEDAAARCRPQAYVALTRVAAGEMARRVPGLAARVIPIGIDLDRFTPDGPREDLSALQRPVTLSVGALEPLKGMDTLVRATALQPAGSLVVLGRGPQRSELAALGTHLLGPKRFMMASARPGDMPRWYRAADAFASASASESFGTVYLEALACGLPVVTIGDAVRREVLSPAATLLPPGTPPGDFAAAIAAALATSATTLPARLSFVRTRYGAPLMASAYASLFDSLLSPSPT